MKRTLFFLSLIIFLTQGLAFAQTPSAIQQMALANQHYEAGDFASAVEIYQALVDAGLEDAILFYNLGNAYFKQEDWGRAILNYRRAQRLTPRDSDIQANLTLARASTIDQLELDGQLFFNQLLKLPEQWFTLNETAIIALSLWFLLILVFIIFTRLQAEAWKQRFSYLLIVVVSSLIISVVSLVGRLYVENMRPDGVIVAEEVDVTSGPGTQYIIEFSLHSGTEISILEERSNWIRITLPGGQLQGWVPASAIEMVSGS